MAELVADARANPYVQWRADLVPGQRNADDIISTPDGTAMELLFDEIDPDVARSEVEAGALVVWSGCGCGDTDCGELEWPDVDDLGDAEPRFDWAGLWQAGTRRVVFAHGSVRWGRFVR